MTCLEGLAGESLLCKKKMATLLGFKVESEQTNVEMISQQHV